MKKIGNILNIIILIIIAWTLSSLVSHQWKNPNEDYKHQLKIVTYNTHAMMIGKSISEKKKMLNYINSLDADIVCLQEVLLYKNPKRFTLNNLREAMKDYPYTYYDFKRYNNKRQFGNVVFSRYPLANKKTIPYESKNNISSRCDILLPDDTIRLIVNHLESYSFERGDLKIDSLNAEGIKNSSLNHKLTSSGKLRREQAKIVKQEINQSPHPVVTVGDFNAIPLSYVYWKIRWGMRDCFLEGSFGRFGNTYKRSILGIRIDYTLCSRTLIPIKCEVDRVPYSDHFPLITTIAW